MEAIEEANNLKELPLKELIGSLMTYEMKIVRQEKEMQEEGKKKSIALKAQEEKFVEETKINNMEDDIAFISKRLKKLMMKDKLVEGPTIKEATTRKMAHQEKKKKRENELEK